MKHEIQVDRDKTVSLLRKESGNQAGKQRKANCLRYRLKIMQMITGRQMKWLELKLMRKT